MFDFDMLFYIYCVKMQMSEQEFWSSSLSKVEKLIDIYLDEINMGQHEDYESKYFCNQPIIQSLKEMEGFGSEQCL